MHVYAEDCCLSPQSVSRVTSYTAHKKNLGWCSCLHLQMDAVRGRTT